MRVFVQVDKKFNYHFNLILFLLILASFSSLIVKDPFIGYDEQLIILPLAKVKSFHDYFLFLKNGVLLDVQPVRDLSHFLDIHLKRLVPFYSFHFTNVIIWFLICLTFKKIVKNCFPEKASEKNFELSLNIFVLCFAFFPPFLTSVAMVISRKHLLSCLFIFLATYHATKKPLHSFAIFAFFLASLLSQPISIFWPIPFIYFLKTKDELKSHKTLVLSLLGVMALFLAVNVFYFSELYYNVGYLKFLDLSPWETMNRALLALGRYFMLFLFPYSALPTPHSDTSLLNLVGMFSIALLVLVVYFLKDSKTKKLFYLSAAYALIALIPVLYKSNIFASDTYVLNAGLAAFLLVFFLFVSSRYFLKVASLVFVLNYAYSFFYLSHFDSSKKMWFYSFAKEPTSESTSAVMGILNSEGQHELSLKIGQADQDTTDLKVLHETLKSIYLLKSATGPQKIELLKKYSDTHPTRNIFLTLLSYKQNDEKQTSYFLSKALFYSNYYALFGEEAGKEIRKIEFVCGELGAADGCHDRLKVISHEEKNYNRLKEMYAPINKAADLDLLH